MTATHLFNRFAAKLLGAALLATALLGAIPDAHAQRAFARRFPAPAAQPLSVKGDIVLVGNTNLTCPNPGSDAACINAHNSATTSRNNDFSMVAYNVDPDGGLNTNSSRAGLTLPAGAQVLFAGLYWAGETGTPAARNTVRLRVPGGGFGTVTASQVDAIGAAYQSFADVTALVSAAGSGQYTVANIAQTAGGGRWSGWSLVVAYRNDATGTLRNISIYDGFQAANGGNPQIDIGVSGFYTPPAGPVNTNIGLVVYDGDRGQPDDAASNPSLLFGATTASLSAVSDAINPIADVWNSSVSFEGANVLAGRDGAWINTLGLDIDNLRPNIALPNGSTSAVLRTRASSNDVNYPGVITLATDVFEPEIITSFTKTATRVGGGSVFRPGDTVAYTVDLENRGNDDAQQVAVTDPLPVGVSYVPGSLQITSGANAGAKTDAAGDDQAEYDAATRTLRFRLGAGATPTLGGTLAPTASTRITFQVTIDASQPGGASLSNVAQVNYVSATSGEPGSGTTPPSTLTVSGDADLSITKTGPASVNAGAPIQYVVTVANAGPDAAANARVTDNVPAGITSVTIACAASGGATCPSTAGLATLSNVAVPLLPAGGSVVFTIDGTAPVAGTTLNNSATVDAPTGITDPVPGNNAVGPVATVVNASVDLTVTGALINAGPVYTGDTVTYTFTITNNGPGGATGSPVSIPVPPQLSGVTWTCAPNANCATASGSGDVSLNGNLANGASLTITITGTAPATTPSTIAATTGTASAPAGLTDSNPANNTATVPAITVTARPIVANADTAGPVNGATGGAGVVNVLTNDTLDGAAATTGTVTLTQLSTTQPGVTLDAATGAVNVAAGTPAGTWAVNYRICQASDPTNCATATASVTVSAQSISATNDASAPVNGASGGTAIANVLANDSLGGAAPTTANVTLLVVTPAAHPGVTLDTATGAVTVAAGTPAGAYTLTYRICEQLNAANCATATATATVTALAIAALDDTSPQVNGASGGTAIASVLANDSLGGSAPTTSTVILSVVTPASTPNVALDPATGRVTVAVGTPAGSYPITYRICEQLNPANCATAVATAVVGAASIDASNDAGTVPGAAGGAAIANVLANDTLNGGAATTGTVTLTQVSTSNPAVTLDPATGAVNVAAGTPAGTFTVTYRICEQLNPSNCDTANAVVTVAAAVLVANPDVGTVTGNTGGPAVPNVLGNDTLDGFTPTLAQVTLTQASTTSPAVTLDAATGTVNVAPGTPAGIYTVTYRFCEGLNPSNCATSTVTVTVTAAVIDAVNDTTPPVNGVAGSPNALNVLGNDRLGGASATTTNVVLTQVSTSNPAVTLDPATGNVAIAPNTPAGTYTLTYRICERLNPANCDTATVTVNVVAPTLVANDDAGSTRQNTALRLAVLGNDTMAGNPVASTAVVVTLVTAPRNGTATVNADGTVTYTPATNYSGTDAFTYRICDAVNPAVCDDAVATLTVAPNTVDAPNATVNTPQNVPLVINPMTTTTTGGVPLDPGSVRIVTPPTNGTVVVNPNGTITFTPNTTFFGTETFAYRICDRSTPTPVCDVATVTVLVAMQAPQLRISKTAPLRAVKVGDLVRYTVVIENTGISPANNATVVDVPPRGFTLVAGSIALDDADDRFGIASTDPIRVTGVDVPVGGRATLVYLLRVGAGVGRGSHTNQVSVTDATGTSVSNTATADVVVEGDPVTEDSLILGTVFVDTDGDGTQDAGEPGMAGVRLATVEGLLIETDVHGRYHVAGIEGGNALRGRNFILKVDAATLPPGSTFTTANPLVRRITPGVPVRFDFGVQLPKDESQAAP